MAAMPRPSAAIALVDASRGVGLTLGDDSDDGYAPVVVVLGTDHRAAAHCLRPGDTIVAIDGCVAEDHASAVQQLDEPGEHRVEFVRRDSIRTNSARINSLAAWVFGVLCGVALVSLTTAAVPQQHQHQHQHQQTAPTTSGPSTSAAYEQLFGVGQQVFSVAQLAARPSATRETFSLAAYEKLYSLAQHVFRYESPLPKVSAATQHRHWFQDVPQTFSYRVPAQEQLWRTFIKKQYVRAEHTPLLKDTGMYPDLDRTFFFSLLKHIKPRRLLEVGAGQSTVVARAALANNSGPPCVHTVIEPYRAAEVPGGVRILKHELQMVANLSMFEELRADDVLFIDSSHVVMPYGDTLFELLSILPRLHAGVYVHFHDIFLPFDYPEPWAESKNLVYTEQWAIALMLAGAEREWEVVWSSWLMRETKGEVLMEMPHYPLSHPTGPNGAAFWIRKLGGPRRGHAHRRAAVWDGIYRKTVKWYANSKRTGRANASAARTRSVAAGSRGPLPAKTGSRPRHEQGGSKHSYP